jgi:RNA polymerase sigma-70 factor (ECF subfamily)
MNYADQATSSNVYATARSMGPNDKVTSATDAGWPLTLEELHAIYSRRLYRTIFSITKNPDDAEDALQDTFLRVHLAHDTFEGRSSVYTWLTRIAVNSALMILRKRRTRHEVLFGPQLDNRDEAISFEVRDSSPNPEEIYNLHHRQLKLLREVGRLDPGLRAPLRMRLLHGRSMKEISRELNLTEAAVKARLYRARKRLCAAQMTMR